ncbi:type II toxin-antitoxin system prevent-host-death family antitoxin [Streptomyces sp. SID8379]|uniref:type II toxin-antitoxin system Phd/YefM family antitoxin n=1 Tax=unclassified Streptomyces TaxID=2593676 RepID=UPI0003613151|nr:MULTISPECIES: type II toxin-antitoxin system prevent-host-death family antitoxin [unclassified Streptomyces]MYW66543.1 type II toxin-antitoxin system prevent-host-death family antitoxin [Streptomyces sp. SID8379]
MKTIGLRELNQNPSKAVALVRSGIPILVTDRGRPVLRMVPETEAPSVLQRMLKSGDAQPPAEQGMPELIPDLAPDLPSLSELLHTERDKERRR